jgi:hypothetical protein
MITTRELSRKVLLAVTCWCFLNSCATQFPEKFESSKLCAAVQCDFISKSELGAKDLVLHYYTTGIGRVFLTEKKGVLRDASFRLTPKNLFEAPQNLEVKYLIQFVKDLSDEKLDFDEVNTKIQNIRILGDQTIYPKVKIDSLYKISISHSIVEYNNSVNEYIRYSGDNLEKAKSQWSIVIKRKLLPI